MLKVLIADDHEIVRRGLKHILREEFPFALIEEASDTDSLVNKALANEWSIIVSDLAMPGGGGIDALLRIRQKTRATPVLILSNYPEEQYALRVMKAGASGYLNKGAAPEELIIAVQRLLSGRHYITAEVEERLAGSPNRQAEFSPHELLSEREFDVLILIASGKSITAIAEQLSLRVTTVSTYRARILSKMNARNNAELIQYGLENDLI